MSSFFLVITTCYTLKFALLHVLCSINPMKSQNNTFSRHFPFSALREANQDLLKPAKKYLVTDFNIKVSLCLVCNAYYHSGPHFVVLLLFVVASDYQVNVFKTLMI